MLLASLPMYDLPETEDATRILWRGLAEHLRSAGIQDVPGTLTRQLDVPEHWLSPDLLFSQTCGYPFTHILKGRVRLIATPCYNAPGCEGPEYCSIWWCRRVLRRALSPTFVASERPLLAPIPIQASMR